MGKWGGGERILDLTSLLLEEVTSTLIGDYLLGRTLGASRCSLDDNLIILSVFFLGGS